MALYSSSACPYNMYPFEDMCFQSFLITFDCCFSLFVKLFVVWSAEKKSLLGAYKIVDRYEGALDPWMSALWNMLYQKNHRLLPNGPDIVTLDATLIDQPKIRIINHDAEEGLPPLSTTTGYFLNFYCS